MQSLRSGSYRAIKMKINCFCFCTLLCTCYCDISSKKLPKQSQRETLSFIAVMAMTANTVMASYRSDYSHWKTYVASVKQQHYTCAQTNSEQTHTQRLLWFILRLACINTDVRTIRWQSPLLRHRTARHQILMDKRKGQERNQHLPNPLLADTLTCSTCHFMRSPAAERDKHPVIVKPWAPQALQQSSRL